MANFKMSSKQKLVFFSVLFIAIFFRFYLISQMPGGLFPDMAANGLDINSMQQGQLQPFYERGNGREALFFYLEWISVTLFGKGVWQFSIVSALFGVLAVLMCYFLTYRLVLMGSIFFDVSATEAVKEKLKSRAINTGLLAMFLMAVSTWHVVLSRTAFRATLIPFFSALVLYFLIRTYQSVTTKTKLWFSFLTGAAFALGFYTYIAFRIMVPIMAMVILWPFLAQIRLGGILGSLKKYFFPIVLFVIGFGIFIFPLAKYFVIHPDAFIGRAGQVSVYNPNLYLVNGMQLTGKPPLNTVVSVVGQVFKTQFLGFFTHGDLNWRQNISGYPFLSPLISPFFGAGLLLMVILGVWYFFAPNKRSGWWKYYLLVGWFFGMMLPVITTAEGIPHGLRGIGTIPVVFIITAISLYEFGSCAYKLHKKIWQDCWCHPKSSAWESAQQGSVQDDLRHPHFNRFKFLTLMLKSVVCFFALALIIQSYYLYFVYAFNSDANFYSFRSDLTPVSQYLIQRCDKNNTYLVLDKFSVQTTDFLTSNRYGNFEDACNVPYIQVDPENVWQLPSLREGQEVVFTQSSMFDTVKFKQYHPEAHLKQELINKFGQDVLAIYK